jgi:hypothetical protein
MLLCHELECSTYDQKKIKKNHNTTAAERHDPDFLIGPRNKKTGKKKVDH